MISCYKKLIEMEVVGADEITLLNAWLADLQLINS